MKRSLFGLLSVCLLMGGMAHAQDLEPGDPLVWAAAKNGTSNYEFITLAKVRTPGHPPEVLRYYADAVDRTLDTKISNEEREAIWDKRAKSTGTFDDWYLTGPVPVVVDGSDEPPTEPGYYRTSDTLDLQTAERKKPGAPGLTKDEIIERSRRLVYVGRNKAGELRVVEADRLVSAPLSDYSRWSYGFGIEKERGKPRKVSNGT